MTYEKMQPKNQTKENTKMSPAEIHEGEIRRLWHSITPRNIVVLIIGILLIPLTALLLHTRESGICEKTAHEESKSEERTSKIPNLSPSKLREG